MELDDLKTIWNEPTTEPRGVNIEHQKVMRIIHGSRRSILKSFTIDVLIGLGLNLAFVVVVILFESAVWSFLYKLIIAANLVSLPIYYRLYKSMIYLKHVDFGLDIKTNLENFLDYYRRTLLYYRRATYLLVVALLFLFLLDNSFLQLDLWIRIIVISYLGIFPVGIGWFVDRLYGRRINEMESYLRNS